MISISIVSHRQLTLVKSLLDDIHKYCGSLPIELLLTINTLDEQVGNLANYRFPIKVIQNDRLMGFGENHNKAFRSAIGEYFCVLNPDIRLQMEPFIELIHCLKDETIGVVAPLVLKGDGGIEDSARQFPNPIAILSKVIGFKFHKPYVLNGSKIYPDWVAGMFMLFRSDIFGEINGFDEKYFLYYEDVDICARLTNEDKRVLLCTNSKVIHLAQRASHRNLKYLSWHIASMVRFFLSLSYWRLMWR